MTATPITPTLVARIAEVLLEGFDRHYRLFRETSARAKARFELAKRPDLIRPATPRRLSG
jgi:isocitrate dehydrogenase kinase/phosphatase